MEITTVPEKKTFKADSKNEKYLLLDDGFIQVYRVWGNEADIAEIARVQSRVNKQNYKGFQKFLERMFISEESSPFGFPEIVLLVRAPIYVFNQWHRHRTGWRENGEDIVVEYTDNKSSQYHDRQEFSGRYNMYESVFYVPPLEQMVDEQGNLIEEAETALSVIRTGQNLIAADREFLVKELGLSKQRARVNTPLGQYTEMYWKQNLWNMLDWLKKRRTTYAQWEIRGYAEAVEHIISDYFPTVYQAWLEVVDGSSFTKTELAQLRTLLDGKILPADLAVKIMKGDKS